MALNNLQWLMCHKTKPNHNSVAVDASTKVFKMPSSPDTHQVLLTIFASMTRSMSLVSTVLGLPDLA